MGCERWIIISFSAAGNEMKKKSNSEHGQKNGPHTYSNCRMVKSTYYASSRWRKNKKKFFVFFWTIVVTCECHKRKMKFYKYFFLGSFCFSHSLFWLAEKKFVCVGYVMADGILQHAKIESLLLSKWGKKRYSRWFNRRTGSKDKIEMLLYLSHFVTNFRVFPLFSETIRQLKINCECWVKIIILTLSHFLYILIYVF